MCTLSKACILNICLHSHSMQGELHVVYTQVGE